MPATVSEALRRFLPEFLRSQPPLGPEQYRALWAINHCRTAALGGYLFDCERCGRQHFAYHSCNHKACPQCGRAATAKWVRRELRKLVKAPYFLVTFTLPAELRGQFFGPLAKQAYDLFFDAVAGALSEKLAADKSLRAHTHGFTAQLHTWNQQMGFHPHIHCLVPGVGLDARGRLVRVKDPQFLVYLPHLQNAFRQHLFRLLKEHHWQVDPTVWDKQWGVHIQYAGSGASALKYLRSFCHPAAKATRLRIQFHTGLAVQFGADLPADPPVHTPPRCPYCGGKTRLLLKLLAPYKKRGPPRVVISVSFAA